MGAWDDAIFSEEVNVDFLDELANLDEEDALEAVEDACTVVAKQDSVSDDEVKNALCAATIAAIWAGAPFSAGEVADTYTFIREMRGSGSDQLREVALDVLENADVDEDLDVYIEALT